MKRIKNYFQWIKEVYWIMVNPLNKRSGLTTYVFYDDKKGITLQPGDSVTFSKEKRYGI